MPSRDKTNKSNAQPRKKIAIVAALIAVGLALGVIFNMPDPVKQSVEEINAAIAQGDVDLAFRRAKSLYKQYPEQEATLLALKAVIEARGRQIFVNRDYQKAIDEVTKLGRQYNINIEPLAQRFYFQWGQATMGKWSFNKSNEIYSTIYTRFANDPQALRLILSDLAKVKRGWENRLLVKVAISYAELVKPPFDENHSYALVKGLRETVSSDQAKAIRTILVRNPQTATQAIRGKLKTGLDNEKINAYLVLNARNQITDDELLRYHVESLFRRRQAQYKQVSIDWLTEQSQKPDWQTRKQQLDLAALGRFEKSRVLKRARDEVTKNAHQLIASAFIDDVKDLLVTRANYNQTAGENAVDEDARAGALALLKLAGL